MEGPGNIIEFVLELVSLTGHSKDNDYSRKPKNRTSFKATLFLFSILSFLSLITQLKAEPQLLANIGWRFIFLPLAVVPAFAFISLSYKLNLLVTLSKGLLAYIILVFLTLGFSLLALWFG